MAAVGEDLFPDNLHDQLLLEACIRYEEPWVLEEQIPDNILIQASESYEKESQHSLEKSSGLSGRFSAPVTDSDVLEQLKQAVPKNTRAQTGWAMRVWEAWRKDRISGRILVR